ncbi:hypothetical protein EVA_12980 [gut metagenome]|uniref:Uncharacterized protein n=1 Tax=gut metagenome TaxID=749906 RepID=J9GHJ4_9ZZZZ
MRSLCHCVFKECAVAFCWILPAHPAHLHLTPCNVLNAGCCVFKQLLECTTIIVVSAIRFPNPITATASIAKPQPLTVRTLGRTLRTLLQESASRFAVCHFLQALLLYRAHSPRIQHIKVTGIDASVPLHHKVAAAAAGGSAGAGRLTQSKVNIVVKQAYTDILAFFPITKPFIKQSAEKISICFGSQGIWGTSPFFFQRVKAGNELKVSPQLFKPCIHFLWMAGTQSGDHTQQIHIHTLLLQQLHGFYHPAVAAFFCSIHPVIIVKIPITVH